MTGISEKLFLVLSHIVADATFDSVCRIQKVADRHIMIQRINDQCDIFAHIACDVIRFGEKLRCLINKVCSKKFIKDTVLVSFVKFFHSFGEETEGGTDKDLAGAAFLKKRCDLKDALTGRNHIIDQDDIFAFKLWSEELVSCDRMTAFDHLL